eukprot:564095_1
MHFQMRLGVVFFIIWVSTNHSMKERFCEDFPLPGNRMILPIKIEDSMKQIYDQEIPSPPTQETVLQWIENASAAQHGLKTTNTSTSAETSNRITNLRALKNQLGSLTSFHIDPPEHYHGASYQPSYRDKLHEMFPRFAATDKKSITDMKTMTCPQLIQIISTQPQLVTQTLSKLQESDLNAFHTARFQVLRASIQMVTQQLDEIHESKRVLKARYVKLKNELEQYSPITNIRASGNKSSSRFDLVTDNLVFTPHPPDNNKTKAQTPRLLFHVAKGKEKMAKRPEGSTRRK